MSARPILVTGCAGFIGSHLAERLVEDGHEVLGVDNLCDFYPVSEKRRNLAGALASGGFRFVEADIRDADAMRALFAEAKPRAVIHLAAMAGVRPSIEAPAYYTAVNVDGTVSLLDAAVAADCERFVFTSSSSVYGNNAKVPFAEDDPVDEPISPYAATKRAAELLCHTYHRLYGLAVFCVRPFTVIGPRQRPDLAIHRFLRRLEEERPIPMFGDGSSSRDYTYVDDIVTGHLAALERCGSPELPGFRIYNLGNDRPHRLSEMIELIGEVTGREPRIERLPDQPGDVARTWADLTRSRSELGYHPTIGLREGIRRQWEWMRSRAAADAV